MIGAGTVINPIIKVVTTVAILAAIYFFFVKPALDTTENISNQFGDSFGDTKRAFQRQLRQTDLPTDSVQYRIQSNNGKAVEKATQCLADAGSNPVAAQECVEKLQ